MMTVRRPAALFDFRKAASSSVSSLRLVLRDEEDLPGLRKRGVDA